MIWEFFFNTFDVFLWNIPEAFTPGTGSLASLVVVSASLGGDLKLGRDLADV